MTSGAVQEALRVVFEANGLPESARVDNGPPWGTWSDLPPPLALWWIGLGITPIWNRRRCPQQNGRVERCQGLIATWGEPAQCANEEAWKEKVAWVVLTQRARYPGPEGRSRLEAYPALAQKRREYGAAWEREVFDLGRVKRHLAGYRVRRRVSKVGRISLYDREYRVGKRHRGEEVWVHLDAESGEWVVQQKDGLELIRHPAEEITAERLCHLPQEAPRRRSRERQRHNSLAPGVPQPYAA